MSDKSIKFNTNLNGFNFSSMFKKPIKKVDIVYSIIRPFRRSLYSKVMNIPTIDMRSKNRITPNTLQMQRLKQLPIYYQENINTDRSKPFNVGRTFDKETGEAYERRDENKIHITDKRVPKEVQKSYYQSFKLYPNLYGTIEQTPEIEIYATDKKDIGAFNSGGQQLQGSGYNVPGIYYGRQGQILGSGKDKIIISNLGEPKKTGGVSDSLPSTLFHEIRHSQQTDLGPDTIYAKELYNRNKKWHEKKTEQDAENYARDKLVERSGKKNVAKYLFDTSMSDIKKNDTEKEKLYYDNDKLDKLYEKDLKSIEEKENKGISEGLQNIDYPFEDNAEPVEEKKGFFGTIKDKWNEFRGKNNNNTVNYNYEESAEPVSNSYEEETY